MSCTYPKVAWQLKSEFRSTPEELAQPVFVKPRKYWHYDKITLPCHKCLGCKNAHTSRRAVQLYAEIQTAIYPCYLLTLTYDPEHLPKDWSLDKQHPRVFIRSLRKQQIKDHNNHLFKYVVKGEYGPIKYRPHYHIAAVNLILTDLVPYSDNGNQRSEQLETTWDKGTVDIINMSLETSIYIQSHEYIKHGEQPIHQKPLHDSGEMLPDRISPYINYSNGIGKKWYDKYGHTDLHSNDSFTIKNRQYQIPEYFDNQLKKTNPELLKQIKENRQLKSKPKTQQELYYQARFNEVKQSKKRQSQL